MRVVEDCKNHLMPDELEFSYKLCTAFLLGCPATSEKRLHRLRFAAMRGRLLTCGIGNPPAGATVDNAANAGPDSLCIAQADLQSAAD